MYIKNCLFVILECWFCSWLPYKAADSLFSYYLRNEQYDMAEKYLAYIKNNEREHFCSLSQFSYPNDLEFSHPIRFFHFWQLQPDKGMHSPNKTRLFLL